MQILQCAGQSAGGTGFLPKRRPLPKERNSCNALPHCLAAVRNLTPAMHRLPAGGQCEVELVQQLRHCLGTVGSATPALHCRITGQVAGGRQWDSCNARAHQLGGRGVLPQNVAALRAGVPH